MTTLLVDGDIVLYVAAAASEQTTHWRGDIWTTQTDLREAMNSARSKVQAYVDRLGATDVVVALSDPDRNWRKDVLPTYKGNRDSRKPPGYHKLVSRMSEEWKVVRKPGLEGDDLLGILGTKPGEDRRIIVSDDKDMGTLPCPWYCPRLDAVMETQEWEADLCHLRMALTGDPVDGYKGCPGVGAVKADKALALCETVEEAWAVVLAAYTTHHLKQGADDGEAEELAYAQALREARVARILRHDEHVRETGEVRLWSPPGAPVEYWSPR